MPSNDARWIIGTIIVVGGLLAAQITTQFGGVNARLDRIETDVRGLDARLRAVEVGLAQLEQRLTTVEQRLTTVEQRLTTVEQRLGQPTPAPDE